jgi:hypothetical protein
VRTGNDWKCYPPCGVFLLVQIAPEPCTRMFSWRVSIAQTPIGNLPLPSPESAPKQKNKNKIK